LDHLPRAFRPAILCARLQAHLRLYRRQPTSPITIGDCVFHPAKRLLIAGATHIHLTITETAILACLTAQSEPVAWTELYQTVWGTPFRNRPSRIDGHVWRLRRKIAGRFLIKIEPAGYSVGCWEDETMPVLAEAV
jgi:DNA-binding response OmpR family regulator